MVKKIMGMLFLIAGMVFIIQCSKDLSYPNVDSLKSPAVKVKPGGGETTIGNNLSFPVIAVDGFSITSLAVPGLTVPYKGIYPGLTADEIAYLKETGPWYPQKTTGNVWQADFDIGGPGEVTYIDWGDNIESVNPKIRAPFRLEVTLYKALESTMTGFNMAVLEYPSSSTELQGTDGDTYEGLYATIVSTKPKLVIQYFGAAVPKSLEWDKTRWLDGDFTPTIIPVTFQPELNVAGKYVYGASAGGWNPTLTGYYRLTFYVPIGGVNLASATIANASNKFELPTEGAAATPKVDQYHNLTYVDVLVKSGGGGSGR